MEFMDVFEKNINIGFASGKLHEIITNKQISTGTVIKFVLESLYRGGKVNYIKLTAFGDSADEILKLDMGEKISCHYRVNSNNDIAVMGKFSRKSGNELVMSSFSKVVI